MLTRTTFRGLPRSRTGAVAVALITVVLAGCTAAAAGLPKATAGGSSSVPAASAQSVDRNPSAPIAAGPVAVAPATAAVGEGGASTADSAPVGATSAGAGIAYPYPIYPGSPGVAADHTIVVTGLGTADLKPDETNRAVAETKAIGIAIADARAQADAIAHATDVTIDGTLSVSASGGGGYVLPMAATSESAGGASSPGAPTTVAPPPFPQTFQLTVTVTVAYRIS
jgi:hypothetical protein